MHSIFQKLFIALSFFVLIITIHYLLQNQNIYDATFHKILPTSKINNKHFEYIHNGNLVTWDALMYRHIKENMYLNSTMDTSVKVHDYIFAPFPLFPLIWKVTRLTPLGICVLNYLFFILSLLILSSLTDYPPLIKSKKLHLFTLAMATPAIMVFMIPYSEATFLLLISIAFWGLFKRKYWIFFIGIFLAAMTRSAAVIISAVFLCTDLLYLFKHRKIKIFLVDFAKKTAPLLLGTLTVSLIQLKYESGSLLKFMEVQKYWSVNFGIPSQLSEWSFSGFSMSITVLIMIAVPSLAYISYIGFKSLSEPKQDLKSIFRSKDSQLSDYLFHLCVIYLVGISFFILFFKGGNLYGLTRYTIASPFFITLIFLSYEKIRHIPTAFRFTSWVAFGFLCFIFICLSSLDPQWNFYDTGYFLFLGLTGLLLFLNEIPGKIYLGLQLTYLFVCAIWISYLFNMYLQSSWICI